MLIQYAESSPLISWRIFRRIAMVLNYHHRHYIHAYTEIARHYESHDLQNDIRKSTAGTFGFNDLQSIGASVIRMTPLFLP